MSSDSEHIITSDEESVPGTIKHADSDSEEPRIELDEKPTYKLRNVLQPGRTTQYTTRTLFEQILQGDIKLDPDYHRDLVWSESKQIELIDSIYRNFYIPPIIFSVQSEEDGTERRICIDGKQRLTSIKRFLSGQIPHCDQKAPFTILCSNYFNASHRFTNEKIWFSESDQDPQRMILSSAYKHLFQNKQIVCVEYAHLSPRLEREIFQRVQLGIALTTAEKLQLITGSWPELIRETISGYMTSEDGLAANLDLDHISRSRDYQNMCHALFSIAHLPALVQATPLKIGKWLNKDEPPDPLLREKIMRTFRVFRDIAKDETLKVPLRRPSQIAPIEFVAIALLIATFMDQLHPPELSQAIHVLRTEIRKQHTDVQANSKVFRTISEIFIHRLAAPKLETVGPPLAKSIASERLGEVIDLMDIDPHERHNATNGSPDNNKSLPSLNQTSQSSSLTLSHTIVDNAIAQMNTTKQESFNQFSNNTAVSISSDTPAGLKPSATANTDLENRILLTQKETSSIVHRSALTHQDHKLHDYKLTSIKETPGRSDDGPRVDERQDKSRTDYRGLRHGDRNWNRDHGWDRERREREREKGRERERDKYGENRSERKR